MFICHISFYNIVPIINEAIEKIAKLIDGSKDAVKIRNKIYGGADLW